MTPVEKSQISEEGAITPTTEQGPGMSADGKTASPADPWITDRARSLAASINEFVEEFGNESDRAAVILIVARLDQLLSEILSRFFLPNTGSQDELLDTDRPLGTFSAKIHVGHRLGLIDDSLARALHLIRRLRNAFAHETSGVKLASGSAGDRIRALAAPFLKVPDFYQLRDAFFKDKPPLVADFFSVAAVMILSLEGCAHDIAQLRSVRAPLIPPAWLPRKE